MADPQVVQRALEGLDAHFHLRPTPNEARRVLDEWKEALVRFPDAAVRSAFRDWVRQQDRYPTLNQFLNATQTAARLIAAANALPPANPVTENAVSPERTAEWLAAIRQVWADAPAEHDHAAGSALCPRCNYADAHLDALTGYTPPRATVVPGRCQLCDGTGWVEGDPLGANSQVVPCQCSTGDLARGQVEQAERARRMAPGDPLYGGHHQPCACPGCKTRYGPIDRIDRNGRHTRTADAT